MKSPSEKIRGGQAQSKERKPSKYTARDGTTESSAEKKQTDREKVRSLTPDEITEIAMARFSGLAEGGGTRSIADLAKDFKHAPALIAESIERAFRDGLVQIARVGKPIEPRRKERIEDRLLNRFKKLNKAIVIESVAGGHSADPLQDPLHRNLGMAMAQFVATGSLFRNNDAIGVGSGRAVNVTLSYFPDVRAQNVTLMSLTGSVYSTPNATKGTWLDADRHVMELAKHFPEPKQYLICHPLAYEPDELERARGRVWLGHRSTRPPTQCLLGVGTVAQGHRFYLEAEANEDNQEPFLKPIHNMLVDLVNLCKAVAAPEQDYSPAAEMSNFFFYVPPPPNIKVPQEKDIKECIRNINSRLLNIQEDLIKHLQLLVVAGTRHKAHTIRALLNNDAYPVTLLCTDAEAATEILNIEEGKGPYA